MVFQGSIFDTICENILLNIGSADTICRSAVTIFRLRVLNKIKLTLNKATKKPQIKWLIIVRRRVNAVRLELN